MIAAEHSTISQRHVAPLVRCPRTARVVARFESLGVVEYQYDHTPAIACIPAELLDVPERVAIPSRDCRCCLMAFRPRANNTLDCARCRWRIPKHLRQFDGRAPLNKDGVPRSYMSEVASRRVRAHWSARASVQEAARLARITALRVRASRAGGGE